MGVAASPEGAVTGLAERVVLGGDAGPVIEGVTELVLDGEASDLPTGLAGPDAHRGHPGTGAERFVVPAAEEFEGFGAECREDVGSDSGEGAEDGEVVGTFGVGAALGECVEEVLDVVSRLGEKFVGGAGLREERIEEVAASELRRLGESSRAVVNDELRTIEADTAAGTARLRVVLLDAWLRPLVVGLTIFLAISGGSWGPMRWVSANIQSRIGTLAALEVQIEHTRETLAEIEETRGSPIRRSDLAGARSRPLSCGSVSLSLRALPTGSTRSRVGPTPVLPTWHGNGNELRPS